MASLASFGLVWPGFKNCNLGPFEIGGNLYAFGISSSKVRAYKSTNAGVDWTEQDSANAPTASLGPVDAQLVGSTLYVLYPVSGAAQIQKFVSDAWVALESGMTTSPPTPSTSHILNPVPPASLAVRADGDYVVLHNGTPEMVMGTDYRRTVYSRFESGTWTTNVDVGGTGDAVHRDCRAILLSASSRVHLFYTRGTNLYVKTLLSTNTLGSEVQVSTSSVALTEAYNVGIPVYNVTDTDLVVNYKQAVSSNWHIGRSNDADTTSWTEDTTVVHTNTDSDTNTALVEDGGVVYNIFKDSSTDDLWIDNDAGAANGWGTNEEIADAVTVAGISANLITDAIGILYSNAGTVTFLRYELTAPAPTGTIVATLQEPTAALVGEQPYEGDIAASLQIALMNALGHMDPEGSISATLQAALANFVGSHGQTGTISSAIQISTFVGSGNQAQLGAMVATLQMALASLVGLIHPSGAFAVIMQAALYAGSGSHAQIGDIIASLQTALFTGEGSQGGEAVTGTIAAAIVAATASLLSLQTQSGLIASTLEEPTFSGSGVMQPEGVISSTLEEPTFSGLGAQEMIAAISSQLQAALMNASGAQEYISTLIGILQAATMSAAGLMHPSGEIISELQEPTFSGNGNQAQAGDIEAEIQEPTFSGEGIGGAIEGTLSGTITEPLMSAVALQIYVSALQSSIQQLSFAASGDHSQSGSIAAILQALTMSANGTAGLFTGQIAAEIALLTFAANGYMLPEGSIASTIQQMAFNGVGEQIISAVIAAELQNALFNGESEHIQTGVLSATLETLIFVSAAISEIKSGHRTLGRPSIIKIVGHHPSIAAGVRRLK